MAKHTATYRGRRVLIAINGGNPFMARFEERTNGKQVLFTKDDGTKLRVPAGSLTTFSLVKRPFMPRVAV